jgi:class 3 adenylate cyclase
VRGLVDEPAQSVLFEQVMHPAVTLAQIAAVASILCGLHAARGRIGMAPFLMTMGMLVVMLFVIGDFGLTINAPLFWSGGVPVDTALLLPLVLTGQVMVYIFDGTQAARRLLVGILCIQLLHHGLDELLVWYALEGAAPGSVPDARLPSPNLVQRLASMGAFTLDFVVLIVTYQLMSNRLAWLPDLVRLSLAMLFAMLTDTLAYSGLLVQFGGVGGFPLVEKVQSVAAAALPTSAYVWFGLRYGEVSQLGGTERRALDVIDLRVKLAKTEARLVESEQRFADVRAVFSRYVSPEVVSAIVEDPSKVALGGEERDVTVLFADIAGYSSLAEVLKPKEVIGLLNQYFEQTATPILARRGMINEFEGDGILAIFGAPLSLKDHAAQALAAAREMLEAVERLNALWAADGTLARWEPSGVDRLRIRIGIHSGAVVAGNVGSAARIKYAVIGDTVNVAARVEALNKTLKTSLLVTAESVAEMGADAPKMEPRGLHPVKGRTELVEVFTLAV